MILLAYEISKHVALGVDDPRHPLLCDIKLPDDQLRIGSIPA